MTADEVARCCASVAGPEWPTDPAESLRIAEALADRAPADAALRGLVVALHGAASAGEGLPQEIAGIRRESLVRWDDWTTTWEGRRADGARVLLRVARPAAARDPVMRRRLVREGRALVAVLGDLVVIDGVSPALSAPIGDAVGDDSPLGVRGAAAALSSLIRWERAGVGPPRLDRREIRHAAGGAAEVCCLTPAGRDPTVTADNLSMIAELLHAGVDVDDPVHHRLASLAFAPPSSAEEAGSWLRAGFAEALSSRRHALARRWLEHGHRSRSERLRSLVARLDRAVPAPEGRGAVGVDLSGRTTVLNSGKRGVWWGAKDAAETVWTPTSGFDPQIGRRLLRAWATAPPSQRLQEEVGGSVAAVDAVTRWVAVGLKLRTLRLILERVP